MVISELGLLSEIWAWSGTYQLAISGGRAALSPPTNTQRNPHSTMTTLPSLYSCDTFLFIFPYNFLCLLFSPAIPPSSPPPPPFPPFLSLFTPSSTSPSTSSSTPISSASLSFLSSLSPPPPTLSPPPPPPPQHSSQESDTQAVSTEVGQLDLLEAGPAEDGSEQAEQVRLFLAGEHDIMQKVFAGQEEEEKRGTQVEIEVRTSCIKMICTSVHIRTGGQSKSV